MTKKPSMLIRRNSAGLFTVHGPDGLYWGSISPKKLSANDAVEIASWIGLTFEQFGQMLTIMFTRDPAEAAAKMGVSFEQT